MDGRSPKAVSTGVLALLFSLPHLAYAQVGTRGDEPTSFVNQQRAVEEEVRQKLDAEAGPLGDSWFDWGGWYSTYVFLFDDGVESSRTLRRFDLRLWGRATLDEGAHEFYGRVRQSFVDFNTGDSYDGNDDDWNGPNLERGYYRFDLGKATRAYEGRTLDYNVVVTAGRDLVEFGTGLALATPLDHVATQVTYEQFELTGLAGKTVGSSPEIDLSRTATRTHRNFLGAQLKYRGFERHQPFTFALWQRDQNHEAIYRPFQSFDYDSFYWGIGSTGELLPRLSYTTEWVIERGHSYGDNRKFVSNDIRAWAFDQQLEYLFPGPHKTRASIQYLFGSGDSDRRLSPTNSAGGNEVGFTDESFVAFGYKDTGLAFAPLYSNLHMCRAGASFFPWPDDRRLRGLQLGTDWYLFFKHHRDGAVSDPTADLTSGYLGWEMDYFANWQLTSDLAYTTRFGVFFPGDAFSDQTTRTFLLVGLTWSF